MTCGVIYNGLLQFVNPRNRPYDWVLFRGSVRDAPTCRTHGRHAVVCNPNTKTGLALDFFNFLTEKHTAHMAMSLVNGCHCYVNFFGSKRKREEFTCRGSTNHHKNVRPVIVRASRSYREESGAEIRRPGNLCSHLKLSGPSANA